MEEQSDMEAAEEAPAEDTGRKQTKQLSLQLGSVIAQWIVLLACLICIGWLYQKSPVPETQWIYVKHGDNFITHDKRISIQMELGSMEVTPNSSILIHCDGLYLFFLKVTIMHKANASLTLGAYRQVRNYPSNSHILKVACRGPEEEVQTILVSEFHSLDQVYLKADHEATIKELTLGLIMLTPRSYCHPE